MEQISDNALMTKVADGDLDKLGLLFERYKKRLYGFFFSMTRDGAKSEDLVQNTFMRVLKYRRSYRSEYVFRVWLFQVARNIAYDSYKNQMDQEDISEWNERLDDESPNQEERLSRNEELMILEKALANIASDKREILTLSKIDGMRYKDISEVLGCTEGTVKAKVFRALKALKKEYERIQSNV